jgi:hypothetical protein
VVWGTLYENLVKLGYPASHHTIPEKLYTPHMKKILTVGEVPDTFTLLQTQDEVRDAAEYLGCEDEDYQFIFVLVEEGEYVKAFGCYGVNLEATVWEIPV